VTELGFACFSYCYALREVSFCPDSRLEYIRGSAFAWCVSLEVINLPSFLSEIGDQCFLACADLAAVTFPADSKLVRIETFAFEQCSSLASLALPASVTFIGKGCFTQCPALSTLTFCAPSQLHTLLDLPPQPIGQQEIPDSVEELSFGSPWADECFRAVSFGRQSKLVEIRQTEDCSLNRCFQQVSSMTLKVLRSRMEFANDLEMTVMIN
jgi:hypothetical protein